LVLGQPGTIRYYGQDKVTTLFGDELYRTNYGLYLQDQFTFNAEFEGTLGVRYDYYDDFGSSTNPRASLVYSPSPQHSFKLIYGEAFRAPSIGDTTVRNNPVEKSNPNLLPEEVATSEFAWIYHKDDFRLISTLYYSKFDNVIEHTPYLPQPPLTIRQNSGILEVSGIEIETRQQFNDIYSFDFNWSHNFKLEQDPQTLARNTASFALNANFGQWDANLNLLFKDEVEHSRLLPTGTREVVNLDSHWLVNFNAHYKFSDSTIGKLTVSNLLDKDYYHTFSSADTLYNGMINRGRQVSLAVEWIW
ncbi:MAG: TonB-dependent receptor, partial [Psychrosphaera sp.]|nr:TonB-dependent receptor [Psychrosphaera sp.]